MQEPKKLLAILGKMALKPEVTFDKLFPKLYNVELWLLAYQSIAPKKGNMTAGVDGKTIDGAGLELINTLIFELRTARYKPKAARRTYIPKANGKQRPLGILSFRDKLVQTVVKLLLEAIYEPLFSKASHGFRPNRSCHTALREIKRTNGIRWWVEGDIRDYFNQINHPTLIRILSKRVKDQRFLHLIEQFLKAGYLEDWQYHRTYSGVAQGGNLSPLLANIYLNELDQEVAIKAEEFNRGKVRKTNPKYQHQTQIVSAEKKLARQNGNWTKYKQQYQKLLSINPQLGQDPDYRRLYYTRFADDTLFGLTGSRAEAVELKAWLSNYLKTELGLELSEEKTRITHATKRVRFLGYDIKRWKGNHILRYRTRYGPRTQRTGNYHLTLLMPRDKTIAFAKKYGNTASWQGKHRGELINLSELEILKVYNAEIRGFLNYYSLADNLSDGASKLLWITTGSFFRTIAGKRRSTLNRVAKSLRIGRNKYAVTLEGAGKAKRQYELVCSSRQLKKDELDYTQLDLIANTYKYRTRTELGKRLLAEECEWCGSRERKVEVHHIRKLANLKGKSWWERQMIERKRTTMVLCVECHDELHAGKLGMDKRDKNREKTGKPRYIETV